MMSHDEWIIVYLIDKSFSIVTVFLC